MRYVNKTITKFKLIFTIGFFFVVSYACKKESPKYLPPSINFITNHGCVSIDTTLLLSDTIEVGIYAETNSNEALTHFNVTVIKDSITTSIDTGIYNNSLIYKRKIVKGIAKTEIWSFYTRDRYGEKSNIISFTLYLDSASIFGNINYIPSIIFGAQNNTSIGGFYSLENQQIYTQADAYNNQSLINLLYYYDLIETDANTIASPGANVDNSVFVGSTGLGNWSELKTTRFVFEENLSIAEFDNCNNDSLILSNTFEFASGKRKAKNLSSGNIYSFITDDGKKGLFKVIDVQNQETGTIEISIKVQN